MSEIDAAVPQRTRSYYRYSNGITLSKPAEESPPAVKAEPVGVLGRLIFRLRGWVREKRSSRRTRHGSHGLSLLSDRMLDDIGISRDEADTNELRNDPGAARMESLAKKKHLTGLW